MLEIGMFSNLYCSLLTGEKAFLSLSLPLQLDPITVPIFYNHFYCLQMLPLFSTQTQVWS